MRELDVIHEKFLEYALYFDHMCVDITPYVFFRPRSLRSIRCGRHEEMGLVSATHQTLGSIESTHLREAVRGCGVACLQKHAQWSRS